MRVRDRILIVDDDGSIRGMLADVFLDEGFEVVQAENGSEALALVEAALPAMIVLDLQMPVMDGPTFYREIRWQGLQVPVVVVSAANALHVASELGADAALDKPFDIERLIQIVTALLSGRSGMPVPAS